ncbi:MAG: CotH kinase family protein [Oscillospiraceae bacterium]|nr:CotH kinase family protein [Oscillospiraceae bacterium]
MSAHKSIDRICVVVIVAALLVTALFMNGSALGLRASDRSMGYETRLFDTSRVHTIEIVMDDWEGFIETCESETYSVCSVVIDNEAYKNVAIRGKGNTSLSAVSGMGSQRYSFKLEFDQYENGKSYRGLDKLSLNNIIQDNTYMKDYLAYRLMAEFGADAPLCSFVWITVNGEDWGLYLAVEGVEDSFLERVYGRDTGELYKPDSMSFGGGGPGNGKDFNMDDFLNRDSGTEGTEESGGSGFPDFSGGMTPPEGFDFSGGEMPEGFDPSRFGGRPGGADGDGEGFSFDLSGSFGGTDSTDVKLRYIDDDTDSYSNIFNNAKTDITEADQKRLIAALKKLSENEDIGSVVDTDEVLRYFVVHNFVCNGDSYTGSIIHNYYLHESDGLLSMIPWDYNLAFGTFRSSDATDTVNDPIDTPMSVSDASDRPMWGWIISSEEYTALYHEYFAEFLDTVDVTGIIDEARSLIRPYVEKDPTAFCTCEEFETGVAALRAFCELRSESVRGQLEGTIPSTDSGQRADSGSLVDASAICISDMGSMGGGSGGGPGRGNGESGSGESDGSGFPSVGGSPFGRQGLSGRPGQSSGSGGDSSSERQRPDRASGSFPGGASARSDSGTSWGLTAVSAAVLLAGLAFAFLFRKH